MVSVATDAGARSLACRRTWWSLRALGRVVRAARPQLAVMSGQLAAGAGNLLFAVVLARVLAPGEYAASSRSSPCSCCCTSRRRRSAPPARCRPSGSSGSPPRVAVTGVAAGATIIAASGPLGDASGLDRPLRHRPRLAAPAAALLGLARGVAYGHEQLARVGASLVTEPAVRLGRRRRPGAGDRSARRGDRRRCLAGYAALAVCATAPPTRRTPDAAAVPTSERGRRRSLRAARRAAVGGPARRQPRARRRRGGSLRRAVDDRRRGVLRHRDDPAGADAGRRTRAGAGCGDRLRPDSSHRARRRRRRRSSSPGRSCGSAFGARYGDVACVVGAVPPGDGVARRASVSRWPAAPSTNRRRRTTSTAIAIGAAALLQAAAIVRWGDRAESVVAITLFTVAGLAVVVELPQRARWRRSSFTAVDRMRRRRRPHGGGDGRRCASSRPRVRVATSRGLWVDEAISVSQAQLPFGEMLADVARPTSTRRSTTSCCG